ncbi:MAG TPA: PAS domain S-box protein [Candidatus Hydrogenedentes bacterium]|nr:PAS domain S-box protein [Candidatus Hydrogenedentota bacterium]HQH52046.1 PAS domain S-box protein [Candidatus Hydrogenedentota bacterium]
MTEFGDGRAPQNAGEPPLFDFLECATCAIACQDAEGRFLECNRHFCEKVLGLPRERIRGQRPCELGDAVGEEILRLLSHESPDTYQEGSPRVRQEIQIRDGNGITRVYLADTAAVLDSAKKLTGFVTVMTDISERKQVEEVLHEAHSRLEDRIVLRTRELLETNRRLQKEVQERMNSEAALRESEYRFRTLADFTYDWEYWIGADGRQLYVSPSCERITGYCSQAFYDRPPLIEEIVHPEDRDKMRGFAFGPPDGAQSAVLDFRIIDAEGQLHWLSHVSQPVYDRDGNWAGRRASNRDITSRKRAEEEVRQLNQWREAIIENANVLVSVHDLNGRYLVWNNAAERITEYPREEILGSGNVPEKLYPDPADRERAREVMAKIARGESTANIQFDIRTKSGRLRSLALFSKAIIGTDGAPAGAINVGIDITQQKRMESERRQLEAQIQQTQKRDSLAVMAGGIAHDFNNLLMGVLGNAAIVLDELAENVPIRKNVAQIEKAARRAAELTRQMLAYSGKGRFVIETLNLNVVLEDMRPLLESAVTKKAEIVFELAPDVPFIEGDAAQLRQLVVNLAMNASEALEDHPGTVTLRTGSLHCAKDDLSSTYLEEEHPEGDYAYFELSDTGCGMSEETKAMLFDPFFTTKFTGRGLGLAAALGIIHGHRGAVKVESKLGEGTTVRVLFPCSQLARTSPAHADAPDHGAKPLPTILVIDDEEAARLVAKEMLERTGYRVIVASDGCEGLQQYQKTPRAIDAVLLDLTMPHLDGEETFHRIRAVNPDARVVLTSGYDEREVAQRFHGLGLAGFLQKPYTPTELRTKIAEVLAKKE